MSRNSAEDPIDPLLADWIDERETSDADTARSLLAADRELLGLFSVALRAAPEKMPRLRRGTPWPRSSAAWSRRRHRPSAPGTH